MQKVKLFKSIESELTTMEHEINTWIERSGARVLQITGNIAPQSDATIGTAGLGSFSASDVLVVVLYESKK